MIEIDGEFFDDPVEKARIKKAVKLLGLSMRARQAIFEYEVLVSRPLFPPRLKGTIVYPKVVE